MRIRRFRKSDATQTSRLIIKTLKEVNSEFYPKTIINNLVKIYMPGKILKRASERIMLVVEDKGKIVGTANISKDGWLGALFIDPNYQRRGIGKKLLNKIECIAKKGGAAAIRTHCSINSTDFYKKQGYRILKPVKFKTAGRTYRLFKKI